MADPWFMFDICVPFGNPNYDVGLGGSHDMDVAAPPNYPVTALLSGVVSDISSPSWGRQVCLHLDEPYRAIPYMAYLHLSAVNPALKMGMHVPKGTLIGWVGGASNMAQYAGTSNPTGQNFLNTPEMSSRVQAGVALMRGPVYGQGAGWEKFPPIDKSLDPTSLIEDARIEYRRGEQFDAVWFAAPGAFASGIYHAVRAAFLAEKVEVCFPALAERRTTDEYGVSIQVQALSSGLTAKWDNQTHICRVYDAFGHQVV